MKTEIKRHLCQQHEQIIRIIYRYGQGLMFRRHIQDYMNLFGMKKQDVNKAIKELKEGKLIDIIFLCRVPIIKLLKFSIGYIKQTEQKGISVVSDTELHIKKTAYINEIVLNEMLSKSKGNKDDLLERLDKFYQNTTYFDGVQTSHEWFKAIATIDYFNKEEIKSEIAYLKSNKNDEKRFDIRNMFVSKVYLGCIYKDELNQLIQPIDILFVQQSAEGLNLANKIEKIYQYMNRFIKDNVKLKFNVYTWNSLRQVSLERSKIKTIKELTDKKIPSDYEIVNLDLKKTLLYNQHVLLF